MARLLYLCGATGFVCTMGVADSSPGVQTTLGKVSPADLRASTPAELMVGELRVRAFYGGKRGNRITLEVVDGPLGVEVSGDQITLSREAHDSAQAVADLLNADPQTSALVTAELVGQADTVDTAPPTELAGGADNGHCIKMGGPAFCRVARIEVS